MTRHQLEHIIRAAAGNADVRDIVVIGSQAVLGSFPNAPAEFSCAAISEKKRWEAQRLSTSFCVESRPLNRLVVGLLDQPKCERITVVNTLIGLNCGNDDEYQVSDAHRD
jgi:hypothetical protein